MLLEFQREFAAAIAALAEGPMRIYRNTVMSGCVDALRANYPVVCQLLGEEMFEHVAADHAAEHPPRQPVLALYGEEFADWLEEQAWIYQFPYLSDVARIERLHIESLFAADAEPLHLGELANADWNMVHLEMHPACRFDWLLTPAASIWRAHQQETPPSLLQPDWKPEGILFARPHFMISPLVLEPAAHRLMVSISNGECIARAALATAESCEGTDVGALFASIVNAGAFAAPSQRSLP